MEIKDQELVEIKSQVSVVEQAAKSLQVTNQEDMNKATDALHNVRMAEKYITEKKTEITGPLMKSLSAVRDLFKPLESNLSEANKVIKAKMLDWQVAEDERIEKEKARIAARVAKGTMKIETAASKLEEVGESGKTSKGEVGKSSIRTVKKVRITDENVIPRMYLVPNISLITEDILKKGITILGVETYEEKTIVSR